MKYNSIKIFIIFVFLFVNNIGLPFGLQYTTLLAPLFFFYTCSNFWKPYLIGLLVFVVFFILQYFGGITSYPKYFSSAALHFSVLITCVAFYKILKQDPEILYKAFDKSVPINFMLTVAAVLLLLGGNTDMWQTAITSGAFAKLPRLRMFTYEPSYYSTLMAPLFLYYFVRWLENVKIYNLFSLFLICISLLLSLSIGVLFALIITVLLVNLLTLKKRTIILFFVSLILFLIGTAILFVVSPNNPLILRVISVVSGSDVSGNARLFESWTLAFDILDKHHSYFTGVGWGNVPVVGHDLIQSFYGYADDNTTAAYTLPNIVCEILAMTGFVGVSLFIWLQLYLYRVTDVKNSIFRKYLFWFIFIYQFTGSYSTSVINYALFIMAYYKPMDLYFLKYKVSRKSKKRAHYNINLT